MFSKSLAFDRSRIGRIVEFLLFIPMTIPLVIGIILIRPWCLVRVGAIRSARIGHLALNPEVHRCAELCLPKQGARRKNFYYLDGDICNSALAGMWSKVFVVHRLFQHASRWFRWIKGGHSFLLSLDTDRDPKALLDRFPNIMTFSEKQENIGWEYLSKYGIDTAGQHICFHHRDSKYLSDINSKRDWSFQDHRDSSLADYLPMLHDLAKGGNLVFRMGVGARERLSTQSKAWLNNSLIDYAMNGERSELLDLFLIAKAQFFIAGGGGLAGVAQLFRVPTVFLNITPYTLFPTHQSDLFITKKLWSCEQQRFLSIREIKRLGLGGINNAQKYRDSGAVPVANTKQEVKQVVEEMRQRIRGSWISKIDDEEMQKEYWNQLGSLKDCQPRSRIGTEFLRRNMFLLS